MTREDTFSYTKFLFLDEELWLLPEKAIFLPQRSALLLADLHIGKSGHFRQHGIPISAGVMDRDLAQLDRLYQHYQPEKTYFLGDLFHSVYNKEWDHFCKLMCNWENEKILIKGNHDILKDHHYVQAELIVKESEVLGPFLLQHEPLSAEAHSTHYVLAGHIHPGVGLIGGGRQKLRLPCFHFDQRQAVLPAFGHFTGLYIIEP
ncbi:MAG: ligase-associated DNA damage response endonuclease PdeM, partial [Bacteroidota bacterium]